MVGDGLSCLFGQQADEGHLHRDRVRRLIFVPVGELETQTQNVNPSSLLQKELHNLDLKQKRQTAHVCPAVDVGSEPHGFAPGGAPPHFTRKAGRVGRDAGLPGVHVAVNFDGVLCTALVRIHPVLP